jgi:hypothetical protein
MNNTTRMARQERCDKSGARAMRPRKHDRSGKTQQEQRENWNMKGMELQCERSNSRTTAQKEQHEKNNNMKKQQHAKNDNAIKTTRNE